MWDPLSHFTFCIFFSFIPFESLLKCINSRYIKRVMLGKMKGGVSKEKAKRPSQQEKDR